jgi:hypothetical protein
MVCVGKGEGVGVGVRMSLKTVWCGMFVNPWLGILFLFSCTAFHVFPLPAIIDTARVVPATPKTALAWRQDSIFI